MSLSPRQFNRPVFHRSTFPTSEFLRSPILHVGTEWAADSFDKGTTHRFKWSPYAEFYDEEETDAAANTAHALFLKEKGLPVSQLVSSSAKQWFPDGRNEDERSAGVGRIVRALSENKIVPYTNMAEDIGSTSYLVPSPWMNLRLPRTKGAMSQHVLPMDYSEVNPSELTKDLKLVNTQGSSFINNYKDIPDFNPKDDNVVSGIRGAAANLRKSRERSERGEK